MAVITDINHHRDDNANRLKKMARLLGLLDNGKPDPWAMLFAGLTAVISLTAFLLMICASYLYWFDDNPPAQLGQFEFVQNEATAGEAVTVLVNLCRYTDGPLHISMAWVDGVRYLAPPLSAPGLAPGCYTDIPLRVDVPHLPPGQYHIDFDFQYEVNFLRTRSVKTSTGYIEIVEP